MKGRGTSQAPPAAARAASGPRVWAPDRRRTRRNPPAPRTDTPLVPRAISNRGPPGPSELRRAPGLRQAPLSRRAPAAVTPAIGRAWAPFEPQRAFREPFTNEPRPPASSGAPGADVLSGLLRVAVFVAVVLGLLVAVLRLTCLRWWQVPLDDPDLAASVAPTLGAGDWLILWRGTAPGFGDLVLCPDPENPGQVFIGRIAAEGGDVLKVDATGAMTVNNARVRSERSCEERQVVVENPRTGDEVELRCDVEKLGGVYHQRALVPASDPLPPAPLKREVERGSVFLISDNRAFPFDSRDFGSLPSAACAETIVFRLVSRLGFSHVKSRLSRIH